MEDYCMNITQQLSEELSIAISQAENTIKLIDDGNTIPFIARYRKELTGSLDDTVLRKFDERLKYLRNLLDKKSDISSSIAEQGKMTNEIEAQIKTATTLSELEDIYRPFRPKRTTRASIAREKGLEGLAKLLFLQNNIPSDYLEEAEKYINIEKEVHTAEEALQGAMDIIAEDISDNPEIRKRLRFFIFKNAILSTSVQKGQQENTVYSMYFDFSEPVTKLAPHRILAIDRAEKEKVIKVTIDVDKERCIDMIQRSMIKHESPSTSYLKAAASDSFSRLIFPSLERELRNALTAKGSSKAIDVFSVNLRNLLLQPPVKGLVTLGLDPAYRTGCKIAVVDATGKVLDTTVIYPTPPQNKTEQAKQTLKTLIKKHGVNVISIGNGTASRESEQFVAELIGELDTKVSYVIVNEAGASVYSASKLGAEEFPQFDVSLRSAVSIARRLQDPLAELVKIDPESIGVGQYQHDIPQKELKTALNGVVESCVNSVGVDLNTASAPLLSKIAGINGTVSKNIVIYREENGHFTLRKELMNVSKLGKKAFEQSAGFLRVPESENILDHTGVHPESYKPTEAMLKILGYSKKDIQNGNLHDLKQKAQAKGMHALAEEIGIGEITLNDIINELLKPGRDPRDTLPKPILRTDVLDIKELKPDMILKGTVRNVVDFGAFVDIGVHEDGLVHISQICDQFIKHPSEALKVGDIVTIKVLEVDLKRKRIALTMKGL